MTWLAELADFNTITSVLVAVLAVVLIGKGVAGLQEAGWVGVHPIWSVRIDILGIYPTLETLLAQVAVLIIALSGFSLNLRAGKKVARI